jgi:hypothetical protein
MMNVVDPDVSREPLQQPRQVVDEAAVERRLHRIPAVTVLPVGASDLVLGAK